MELDNWIQSIAARRWPILPDTLAALHDQTSRHPDLIRFTDLANLTLSDPLLLFDLLRVIGGSRALQRNESVPSIEQAMMLIGLEGVVARFSRLVALDLSDGRFSPEVLEAVGMWLARGRVAALTIKDWLSAEGDHKVEDCFVAALVYNLPACFYLLYRNEVPVRPLLQQVADTFATDYPKVLEHFVRQVPLPVGLQQLLGGGAPNRRRQLLKLAVAAANGLEQGHWRSQWQTGVDAAARLMGIPGEEAYHSVVQAVLQVARHSRAPGYAFPVRELLFLEGEYHRIAPSAAASLPVGASVETALKEAVRHLANDLKFQRILFLRYDRPRHVLKLRYQVGLPESHPLRKLPVELEPGSFFALLTSKPQSFHAPAMVRAKLVHKYPDAFFDYLGDQEFAVMTVFTENTLHGVFYVDNGLTGQPIGDAVYMRFKELVARMTHIL
ncbi:HDOD domain-containing protein [Paludibacterium paludis]|uniref:HDOD domain-containing protein n=1 Tax=Paludibacterium paludis TaxID=1225769 RepID=A0A918P1E3_9NEIS|nr:HDOD domain-containing protein [Paludibacterium paludis]GGY13066.1 hypothetical protein GCM10011289_15320 [Paludibacterium paludis]